jgi:flagellar biosynthesis/type III secretory pathway protein FliH
VKGLENFKEMMELLTTAKNAIKVYVNVADYDLMEDRVAATAGVAVN